MPVYLDLVLDNLFCDEPDLGNIPIGPTENPDVNEGWNAVTEDTDPGSSSNFHFFKIPGPQHCPPGDSPPIAYFNLFFTLNLLTTFVTQTNNYAAAYFRTQVNNASMKWKPVTLLEMKAFIAVLLNMRLNKKPTIDSYWSTSMSQTTPWFQKCLVGTDSRLF